MTFEEFFKKKRISLQLLQEAEPALFLEFEAHYREMGEKSFDHTKKYWFNQLRHKYPAPPEVKVEKVVIENQIAEQTIADTLTEPATPAPNVGFKPRFNSGMAKKPSLEQPPSTEPEAEEKPAIDETPNPSLGFKPKFRAASPPKPAEENIEIKPDEPSGEPKASLALGFKPKFRAASPPKPVQQPALEESETKEEPPVSEPAPEAAPKSIGFKPRFNAKNIKPKEGRE